MTLTKLLLIGLGGFLGSIARYITSRTVDQHLNVQFPYGTLTVNIIGSFFLGIIYGWALRRGESAELWRSFLGAGFCGGFTTFSTFSLENLNLLEQRQYMEAGAYTAASLLLGILFIFFGVWLSRNA